MAVSLARKAAALVKGIPLYEYLAEKNNNELPIPMCNILNGGAHASNNIDIQEFMIMPIGARTFSEGIRWCAEIFNTLKGILTKKRYATTVGDEGGFAPDLESAEVALDLIVEAVKLSGYKLGEDIKFAIDAAASEWWVSEDNYVLLSRKKDIPQHN